MSRIETLATLAIDKRRGTNTAIKVFQITTGAGDVISVACALCPHDKEEGIVIGTGANMRAALNDAQATLQASLDSVDVAILKGARS